MDGISNTVRPPLLSLECRLRCTPWLAGDVPPSWAPASTSQPGDALDRRGTDTTSSSKNDFGLIFNFLASRPQTAEALKRRPSSSTDYMLSAMAPLARRALPGVPQRPKHIRPACTHVPKRRAQRHRHHRLDARRRPAGCCTKMVSALTASSRCQRGPSSTCSAPTVEGRAGPQLLVHCKVWVHDFPYVEIAKTTNFLS